MTVNINIKIEAVPFGSYHVHIASKPEEMEESEEMKRLLWPYEFPSYAGSMRAPITIWSTIPVPIHINT